MEGDVIRGALVSTNLDHFLGGGPFLSLGRGKDADDWEGFVLRVRIFRLVDLFSPFLLITLYFWRRIEGNEALS